MFFRCIRLIIPPIQGTSLGFDQLAVSPLVSRCNTVIGYLRILKRPSTVIALVVFAVLGSGWLSSNLGATLLPEMKQGRFAVDVELPIGTPLTQTANTSLNLEEQIRDC